MCPVCDVRKPESLRLRAAVATEALRDYLEHTDWNLVADGTENVNDVALAISGYITFCKDRIIPKKTVKMFSKNKPWVTPE